MFWGQYGFCFALGHMTADHCGPHEPLALLSVLMAFLCKKKRKTTVLNKKNMSVVW